MYDVTIIGAGILGLATGHALLKKNPDIKIIILEKEPNIGQHQTGHNSGVIHSGIYYKPGSLKAINCRYGISLLLDFCNYYNIAYDICGKVILAQNKKELDQLHFLKSRGEKNGIKGLKILSRDQILEYEPHAAGFSALYCPETGIINYGEVCKKLSKNIEKKGEIITSSFVTSVDARGDEITIFTEKVEYKTRFLINCAGLFSDQISELSGFQRKVRIVPFRGEYYTLNNHARHLVRNLIYPVPDYRYPFLGVHFTRTLDGQIEAGPNAVLALAREGYNKTDINLKEIWDYLSYTGFWHISRKYWTTAMGEYYRSFFKGAFVNALQKLVPEVTKDDIVSSPAGVRAQALAPNGDLVDDFVIDKVENMVHVINAPSPAATSSLAIGDHIAKMYNKK